MPPSLPSRAAALPRLLAALLLLAVMGAASAYDGFSVGLLGGPPTGGSYVLNLHAVQPVLDKELSGTPMQFSARADLISSLSFRSLPALGLGAVSSATVDGVERYLGLGGGVSSLGGGVLWSIYGLAGFRVPISGGLHGALELQLTSNSLVTSPRVGLALEYTFGGK